MISFSKEDVIIVTGASSGIGLETALLLNELGAAVIAVARNEERLNKMKAECKYPENMHLEIKDLTENIETLPDYVKELKNKYGKFQGMAYCAGISDVKPLQLLDLKEMKNMFDINYFAPIFMTKGFADRRNNTRNRASVVVISSAGGFISDKGHTSYAGSKAAIAASCNVLAKEAASSNIRINCVSPSKIKTPMTIARLTSEYEATYPFGCGKPKDAAYMIVYLLSKNSEWTTGQNYIIDCASMH